MDLSKMPFRLPSRTGSPVATRSLLLALGLALASLPAPRELRAQGAARRPTDALAWLSGCWERRTARGAVFEQWMPPAAGMMLGASRTTRGDTVVSEYEVLRLFERRDTVIYHATPSRQQPTEFATTRVSDTLVVFENPAHDFPQRIIYRKGGDSLFARIEGKMNGQERGVDFRYGRTACVR